MALVCLGAPKQEKWMAQYGAATGAKLLLGLGGSLDVFAGVAQRAPEFYCKHNLGVVLPAHQKPVPRGTHDEAAALSGPCGGGEAEMNKGRLIVFEGTDGSGKATQSRLLFERLEREGVDCRRLNFPRYGESPPRSSSCTSAARSARIPTM